MKRRSFMLSVLGAPAILPGLASAGCARHPEGEVPPGGATASSVAPFSGPFPAPSSGSSDRAAPTAFSPTAGLPGLDIDMLADSGLGWSIEDRFVFRSDHPSWWYADLSTGTLRVLTADGGALGFTEATVSDLGRGGDPQGATQALSDAAAVVDPRGACAYSLTTAVEMGPPQAGRWSATVLKTELVSGRVLASRELVLPASAPTAKGSARLAVSSDALRLTVALAPPPDGPAGPCWIEVLSTADLTTVLTSPQGQAPTALAGMSGDAVMVGATPPAASSPASPPYRVLSTTNGSLLLEVPTSQAHLLDGWLYWAGPDQASWRAMDLGTRATADLGAGPPGAASHPEAWSAGAYSVIRTPAAADLRELGSPTPTFTWPNADGAVPTGLAVYDDVLYTVFDSRPGEVVLTDLRTGEELTTALIPGDLTSNAAGALEVTHEGIGVMDPRGRASFYAATAWR
ncbi:hypothetical protein [Actinomyces marmotae]|uniref:Lipoprotein n=1 Tax=Actinomyces marmotae TaxID=2737173 RepID=A0A6M8B8C3_9ACTO|nr:hypothetical protein [Actinomyces marmotae]QKD79145.1 hypothetical protein HPC72_01725 [Actinomyces marmotae]